MRRDNEAEAEKALRRVLEHFNRPIITSRDLAPISTYVGKGAREDNMARKKKVFNLSRDRR